jgi:hypothetical protein
MVFRSRVIEARIECLQCQVIPPSFLPSLPGLRYLAILINLVIGLCFRNGFYDLPKARRLCGAKLERALEFILSG